ncbi:hypothetical protein FKM82_001352 [Ascaphus truei]
MLANHAITAIKGSGHTGLEQLSTLATSVKAFLGPVKSCKFIFDPSTNESTLTCSSFRLLESLDLTSAIGQLLNETVQAHHKSYKTGSTTLFFLVGAWSNAVLECLRQGVPVSLIVSIMLEGLNSCIEQVQSLQLPLHDVFEAKDCTNKRTAGRNFIHTTNPLNSDVIPSQHENDCVSQCDAVGRTACECPKSFLKLREYKSPLHQAGGEHFKVQNHRRNVLSHSRHFSVAERSCFQSHSKGSTAVTCCYSHSLGDLAKALSHGNQQVMDLAQSAVNHLCENAEETSVTINKFHATQLDTCCLPGLSEEYSNASFGYTILVSPEIATISNYLQGKPLQVILVDGDLTERYRHLGFNNSANIKTMSEIASSVENESEDMWASSACMKIIQANIDLILVRGDVCPILLTQCIHRNILIITHVKQNVLQAFSEATGAEPVTYLTQISQDCVGTGAYVNMYTKGNSVIEVDQRIAITIKANKMNLLTVMLTSSVTSKMQIMEDQFWTCVYRLHHALRDQNVFLGGGAVELLCLSHLRKLEDAVKHDISNDVGSFPCMSSWLAKSAVHYKASVFRCLAKGWYKYLSVLLCNMDERSSELDAMTFIQNELQNISDFSSPSAYILKEYSKKVIFINTLSFPIAHGTIPVYDNVIPKLEAWRRALHLVLLVLQTDAEIVTGSEAQKQILKSDIAKGEYLLL